MGQCAERRRIGISESAADCGGFVMVYEEKQESEHFLVMMSWLNAGRKFGFIKTKILKYTFAAME